MASGLLPFANKEMNHLLYLASGQNLIPGPENIKLFSCSTLTEHEISAAHKTNKLKA